MTTPPFLVDRRVVVVRDAGRLSAADAARLAELLADPVEGVTVVFAAGGGTVPPALSKAVAACGEVRRRERRGVAARTARAFVAARAKALGGAPRRRRPWTGSPPRWARTSSRVDGDARDARRRLRRGRVGRRRRARAVPGRERAASRSGTSPTRSPRATRRPRSTCCIGSSVPGGRAAPAVVNTLQRHLPAPAAPRRRRARGPRRTPPRCSSVSAFPAGKLLAAAKTLGAERIRQAVAWIAAADEDVKGATALEPAAVLEILVARLARLHRAAGRGAPSRRPPRLLRRPARERDASRSAWPRGVDPGDGHALAHAQGEQRGAEPRAGVTDWPATDVIREPAVIPAAAAGVPLSTETTGAPFVEAADWVISDAEHARRPRRGRVVEEAECSMDLGDAECGRDRDRKAPRAALGREEPAVSTPTTVPEAVVSAPPESPEMSAALVCEHAPEGLGGAVEVVGRRDGPPSAGDRPGRHRRGAARAARVADRVHGLTDVRRAADRGHVSPDAPTSWMTATSRVTS